MDCREDLLAALLAGELEGPERAAADHHLLTCESCWQAVREDRAARSALARLREPAPEGLADRIALAVELEGRGVAAARSRRRGAGHRPRLAPRRDRLVSALGEHRRAALAAAVALAVAGLLTGLLTTLGPGTQRRDGAVVTAVAQMATARSGGPVHLAATQGSEHVRIAGRQLTVRAFRVEGVLTVVAIASAPFAEPATPATTPGSSSKAWMASTGGVGLYCLNAPPGRHSMLVAARMPAVELPGVLSRLHLAT